MLLHPSILWWIYCVQGGCMIHRLQFASESNTMQEANTPVMNLGMSSTGLYGRGRHYSVTLCSLFRRISSPILFSYSTWEITHSQITHKCISVFLFVCLYIGLCSFSWRMPQFLEDRPPVHPSIWGISICLLDIDLCAFSWRVPIFLEVSLYSLSWCISVCLSLSLFSFLFSRLPVFLEGILSLSTS